MKTIRVGIIGFGLSGKIFHARVIQSMPGFSIASVVSSRADEVQEELPGAQVLSNAEQIFADSTIDLVVIATPNEFHAPLATQALSAGKHVVVEKPFVVSSAEGRVLVECAKHSRRLLSVFHNRRWDNGFLTLRDLMQKNELGTIYQYEARYERFRPTARNDRWREQPKAGSGVLFDLGSHLLDQVLVLFGKPQGLYCELVTQKPNSTVDDYFHILLDYHALRVSLRAGGMVSVPGAVLEVHGDKGSFIKRGLDPQEEALKAGASPSTTPDWGLDSDVAHLYRSSVQGAATEAPLNTIPGSYQHFYEGVYQSIVHNQPALVSAEEALTVIELIEACMKSSQERRYVTLERA
jgi:scyllo-inositol 2-dehydrogenase (NADP+)